MKLVVQRVASASVSVEGTAGAVGEIGKGLCVLIGLTPGDGPEQIEWAKKIILTTKFWPDEEGKQWKVDVKSSDYQVLLVSQFTLYAKIKKNKSLDFHHAMGGADARVMYDQMVSDIRTDIGEARTQIGEFGGNMQVSLQNDGPVTISFDSNDK